MANNLSDTGRIKKEFVSIKGLIAKIIYAAIIALFVFSYRTNAKIETISSNAKSIEKLWAKYGELKEDIHELKVDIEVLKSK